MKLIPFRQPKKYQNTIGVHEYYKIPLIFLKEETQWKYYESKEQLKDENNITGLLCPHVYLENSEGKVFSLRSLPEILRQRNGKDKIEASENFYIVLKFKEEIGQNMKTKIDEIIADQIVQGETVEVHIKELSTPDGKALKNEDEKVLFCKNYENMLQKPRSSRDNVIIIRSDAIVIARV